MAWLQLIFHTPNAVADPLANILSELGAAAVTMADAADQSLYEPSPDTMPLWQNTNVIGLFAMGSDLEAVRAATAKALAPVSLPAWRLEVLEDQKWERLWLENFRPMRFGEQVWIVPSGYSPPAPQAINVLLDPGLAFGTGTHPTTRLCLEWLDRSYLRDATVIDYGCGSGVLAITAALLGAKRVWAIDHDTQAILATNDNAQRNGVADKIHACPPDTLPPIRADMLIANILAQPLIQLAGRFADLLKGSGLIALSGILREQAGEITDAYRTTFHLGTPCMHDDWVLLDGRRKAG